MFAYTWCKLDLKIYIKFYLPPPPPPAPSYQKRKVTYLKMIVNQVKVFLNG